MLREKLEEYDAELREVQSYDDNIFYRCDRWALKITLWACVLLRNIFLSLQGCECIHGQASDTKASLR